MNNAVKTIPQILRENICTSFNLLNLMIAAALVSVGAWKNTLFFLIVLLNTVIGIVQELRARRQIMRLTLLNQPMVTVIADGKERQIRPEEIVDGDVLALTGGGMIPTDCTVLEGRLEVSEAILTGESEPVIKNPGDKLLSGSSVIAGRCLAEAECPVHECFTAKMVDEVKKNGGGSSHLLSSMKKVTRFTGFLIVPLGILLFIQAFFFRGAPLDAAVISTSAGLLGMLPKGLVLLISIGLAVGVIRLSRKNVLVRDLHSLENLARCDVLCLDKTGTLTEGSLTVESVYAYIDEKELGRLMATYLAHTTDNNSTFQALREYFPCENPYSIADAAPFSSERKWSSVTLSDSRRFILGAPEKLCREIPPEAEALMAQGKRVLLAVLCPGGSDELNGVPAAMLVLTDKLRKNAAQTVRYFYEQGVDIKIISGDSPISAAAAAKLTGVKNADRLLDASSLSDEELARAADRYTVFGRVTPKQKKVLVAALQKAGHTVAMTGDGVNDLLAMRQADCSAAMGAGSDAARQTAQLVLLDSDFSVLRDVIAEGRRVVGNLTKSAGVFFIKTIYSVLLCILCLLVNADFPFIPIQITLIDAVIEAFPAFFISFEPSSQKADKSFLRSALRCALPNGISIFLCCTAIFFAAPALGIDKAQANLLMYLTVGTVSLAGVVKASLPLSRFHAFLCAASTLGFFCAAFLFAPILQLSQLSTGGAVFLPVIALLGIITALLLQVPFGSGAVSGKIGSPGTGRRKSGV